MRFDVILYSILKKRLLNWTPEITIVFCVTMILLGVILYRLKWSRRKKLTAFCFGAYVFEVLVITLLSRNVAMHVPAVVLEPFFMNDSAERKLSLALEYVFNIIMLLPLGAILPLLLRTKRKYIITMIVGTLFTLIIEVIQAVFRIGTMQTDDILANIIGVFIGIMLSRCIQKRIDQSKDSSDK